MVILLNSLLAFPLLWYHMLKTPSILSDKIPWKELYFKLMILTAYPML